MIMTIPAAVTGFFPLLLLSFMDSYPLGLCQLLHCHRKIYTAWGRQNMCSVHRKPFTPTATAFSLQLQVYLEQ